MSKPASPPSWFVPAAGTRPRSWLDGVGRCHPGTMPLAPCSGRKEQRLVAISRRYSDGNLSCRQRSPDLAMCCYSAPNHDSATKMCTKIVSDGDHRSRDTATFGKRPPPPPPPCTCPTLVTWIIARNVYGCHHSIPNWSRNSLVPNNVGCNSHNRDNMPRKSNMGFFCWVV